LANKLRTMKIKFAITFIFLLVIFGCKKDEVLIPIEFLLTEENVGERSTVKIDFNNPEIEADYNLRVAIIPGTASTADFAISEVVDGDEILLSGTNPSIEITGVFDTQHESDETVTLEIIQVPGGYSIGSKKEIVITVKNNNIGDDLVGEYLFNGNAEDTNPGNSNHDGTVFGATLTTDRKNTENSAYSFDGINDYISIPDNEATDFNSSSDFSISLWIKPNTVQSDEFHDILRKWVGDNQPYPFSISLCSSIHPTNPNQFFIASYDGLSCGHTSSSFSSAITYTNFQHLVVIKSGNQIHQYLNGAKVSQITSTLSCETSNNSHITIGCRGQLVRFFAGKIDDIRFYKTAISESVISELYNEGN